MDYGAIIKRAWHVTWRYKALWVLGMFAGVSGCQSSGGSGGRNNYNLNGSSGDTSFGGTAGFERFAQQVTEWMPAILAASLVLFVIGVLWSVFRIAAQGGLVSGVNSIEQGAAPRLGELWGAGFARFWSLVGLGLLLRFPVFVGAVVLVGAMLMTVFAALRTGAEPDLAVLIPVFGVALVGLPILALASSVLGAMHLIALRYVMLGGQGARHATANSWRFLRARLKDSVLMWFINFGLNLVASVALAVPAILLGIAVAVPLIAAVTAESYAALIPVVGVALVAIIALGLLYDGVWGTFTSALWTLFFRRVTGMHVEVATVAPAMPSYAQPAAAAYPPVAQQPYPPMPSEPPAPPAQPAEPPLQPVTPMPPVHPGESPYAPQWPAEPPAPPAEPPAPTEPPVPTEPPA